jgi:uncharacterized protein (TIGR02996 family)
MAEMGTAAEDGLLAALLADPADDEARLVYADWLEERGDPRADYLRLSVALAALVRQGGEGADERRRLLTLAEALPRGWREAVGKRFDVVLSWVRPDALTETMLAVMRHTGSGLLLEARRLVEEAAANGPRTARRGILLEDAEVLKEGLEVGPSFKGGQPRPEGQPRCRVTLRETVGGRPHGPKAG